MRTYIYLPGWLLALDTYTPNQLHTTLKVRLMIGKKTRGVTRQLASCQSCRISKSICLSNCWSEKSSTLWWMLLLHDTSSDEHKINNWSNFPAWEKLDFVQELYIYEDIQKKANGSNNLRPYSSQLFWLKFVSHSYFYFQTTISIESWFIHTTSYFFSQANIR